MTKIDFSVHIILSWKAITVWNLKKYWHFTRKNKDVRMTKKKKKPEKDNMGIYLYCSLKPM